MGRRASFEAVTRRAGERFRATSHPRGTEEASAQAHALERIERLKIDALGGERGALMDPTDKKVNDALGATCKYLKLLMR